MESDNEQHGCSIDPIVPGIDTCEPEQAGRKDECDTDAKVDSQMERVGKDTQHAELVIRQQGQDKRCHSRDDR